MGNSSNSQSIDRRGILKIIGIGGAGALAGCSSNQDTGTSTETDSAGEQMTQNEETSQATETSQPSGETVRAWAFANHADVLAALAEKYDGPHNITPQEQQPGQIGQKLVTALQSQSNLPTISLMREGQIRPFALNGGVLNLDDLVRQYEDQMFDLAKGRFRVEQDGDPSQKTGKGQFFGIPNDLGPMAIVYNTEVFSQAGLPTDPEAVQEEIQTWDQFISAGQTIKSETGADMVSFDYAVRQSGVPHALCTQAGGLYYNPDGQFAFDQPANVRAMEKTIELKEVNRRETWFSESYISGLKNNEIATIPAPFWFKFVMRGVRETRGTLQDMSGVWRVMPMPRLGEDTPRASNFGGVPAGIPSSLSQGQAQAGRDFGEYWHLSTDSINQKLRMGAFPAIEPKDASELTAKEEYYGGQRVNKIWTESARNCPRQYLPPNSTVTKLKREAHRQILEEGADIESTLSDFHQQMERTL